MVKNKRVKAVTIMLVAIFVIFGVAFLLLNPHRDPQLTGTWHHIDGNYARIFHADGSGSVEPEVNSVMWRTRDGQLIITSMGVERHYSYSISEDGHKLVLTLIGHDGRSIDRTYIRLDR